MPVTAKSPDAFRTISEVASWLETPAHVLRFWESRFPEVAPVKGAGGRRYYRPEDMRLLGGIKQLLHTDGRTIKAVQEQLAAEGVSAVAAHSPELPTASDAPVAPGADLPPPEPATATVANDAGRPPIGYFFDDSAEPAPAPPSRTAAVEAPATTPEPEQQAEPAAPALAPIDTLPDDPEEEDRPLLRHGPTLAAELRGLDPDCPAPETLADLAVRLRQLRDRMA